MIPRAFDLFDFWRWFLAIACTVYTIIFTARWAWGWVVYLSARDRSITLLRHYVIVQALRLRLRRFQHEAMAILGWTAALVILLTLDGQLMASR